MIKPSSWDLFLNSFKNPVIWLALLIILGFLLIRHGAKYSFRLKHKLMYFRPARFYETEGKWKFCSWWKRWKLKQGWLNLETASAAAKLQELWSDHPFWYDFKKERFKTILSIDKPIFIYKFCYFFGGIIVNLVCIFILAWWLLQTKA